MKIDIEIKVLIQNLDLNDVFNDEKNKNKRKK